MGEAKRKRRAAANRTWMTGHIKVVANDQYCFGWTGTREQAIAIQELFHETASLFVGNHECAVRGTGYLMCYGMPPRSPSEQHGRDLG
jgi:hypothetical protein